MLTLHHDPGQPRYSRCWPFLLATLLLLFTPAAFAVTGDVDLTTSAVGYIAVVVFVLAYALVMAEEKIHMRKSKPVLVAAGCIREWYPGKRRERRLWCRCQCVLAIVGFSPFVCFPFCAGGR